MNWRRLRQWVWWPVRFMLADTVAWPRLFPGSTSEVVVIHFALPPGIQPRWVVVRSDGRVVNEEPVTSDLVATHGDPTHPK
jgi:hypothetical protein